MKKYFKHTKKLVFLALTVVMMLASSLVVLADTNSQKAADPTNLTILKVGTQTTDKKTGELSFDKYGNKTIKTAKPVLYTNGATVDVDLTGTEDGSAMVELPNSIKLDVDARIKTSDGGYKNGYYTVKSSDESIATVTQGTETLADGRESQYIIISAGQKSGTATIKLAEQYPTNPLKPKTVTVKVTVKTLVDTISFDDSVVKDVDGVKTVNVGVKGSVTLGTTTNAASNTKLKYVVDKAYSKYFSVNAKGVLTAKNRTTESVPNGYIELRVVAQDQTYTYPGAKKAVVWGENETIRVYINQPELLSVKVVNATLKNESDYLQGKKAQAYEAINLKTNALSNAHTYKLQVNGYTGTLWFGDVKPNAVTYTSSNPKAVTVDKNGVLTAVANGKAKITITPADGVKLAGKEAVTLDVVVTTDVEKIELASKNVTAFTGAAYTIKASTNTGVDKKLAGLTYEIVSMEAAKGVTSYNVGKKTYATFEEQVIGQSGEKNIVKGKIRSDIEGTVVVRVASATTPSIYKDLTIKFVNAVDKITATVPSYDAKAVKEKNSTTLYLDRVTALESVEGDTCYITTTVTEKVAGVKTEVNNLDKIDVSSNNTSVATVEKVKENGVTKIKVTAVGKGQAKITLAANDGSKKSANVTIKVVQKVNDITVTNAGIVNDELAIYLAPNAKGVTTTSFVGTPNADADNKKVTYSFTASDVIKTEIENEQLDASKEFTVKGQKLTLSANGNAAIADYLEANGKILLGTLTVTANDGIAYNYEEANAVGHIPYSVNVKVYAVAEDKYMTQADLEAAVKAITGGQGFTLAKGDKLAVGTAIEIPADITVRTLTYKVTDGKNYASVDGKGNISAKKVSGLGAYTTITVSAASGPDKTDVITTDIKVRVVNAVKDYSKAIDTQITALLKDNNYSWLGATPTYKNGTLTLAISDITMSKEAANAEMREKLTSVMHVVKDAADLALYGTTANYQTLTVVDASANKTWCIDRVGSEFVVYENDTVIGTYGIADSDAAIDALINLITDDVDEIVEWANKKLAVTLVSADTVTGFAPYYYSTQYTVAITAKDADIETFIDTKIAKATAAFTAQNEAVKDVTGIDTVKYDADTNTTIIDIYNSKAVIADAYAAVKDDAVVALEDIFTNAASATVEVVAPEKTYEASYVRGANTDVNNLVDELYAKLCEELPTGATMNQLEGTTIYATVNFDFSGTVYTKSYVVTFKRTTEAIDADVDARLNTLLAGLEGNGFGTVVYDTETNTVTVVVDEFKATLKEAAGVVSDVEAFVNTMVGDVYAKDAVVGETIFENVTYESNKISATDVLMAVKPEWYSEDAEVTPLNRQLSELVGTGVTVAVYYGADFTAPLYYTVNFDMNMDLAKANIDAAIADQVAVINAADIAADSIVLEAEVTTDAAVIVLNEDTLTDDIITAKGTGLYTLIENVLVEAKANCGDSVGFITSDVNAGFALPEVIDKAFVAEIIDTLGIEKIGDLAEETWTIGVYFSNNQELAYTVEFTAKSVAGTIEEYPMDLPLYMIPGSVDVTVGAGKTLYCQSYNIGGTIMTINNAEGCTVVCGDETYEAVDGKIVIELPTVRRQAVTFAVQNNTTAKTTYTLEFTYPVGTQMNPDELEVGIGYAGYNDASIAEGNTDGYYYTYTAEETGTVNLWFAEATEGVEKDVIVTTSASYKQYTLTEDGEEDWLGDLILTVPVTKGDELAVMVVVSPDENWNYPAMDYSLAAAFEYPLGSQENPIDLEIYNVPGSAYVSIPAGETVYYQSAYIGGTILTMNDATGTAVVISQGESYKAENGVITVELPQSMMRQPVSFGIQNTGDMLVYYQLSFAYPLGSQMNPDELYVETGYAGYNDGHVDSGETYYYTYTAEEAGTVDFWFAECTEGVDGDIIVTNMRTYNQVSLSYDGVADAWGDVILTVAVEAGDELDVQVVANPDADWNYPAMDYSVAATFNYPLGSENNPITLSISEIPCTIPLTVEAGETVYYQGTGLGGVEVVITNAVNGTVLHNGTQYPADGDKIEFTLETPWQPMMPVTFAIHNGSTVKTIYQVSFSYAEGVMDNPKAIELGTYSTTEDEYWYQYTATEAGTVEFDISTTEGGWQYCINVEKADGSYVYGENHWCDDTPVVGTQSIDVEAGDVVKILVVKYSATGITAAETITFSLTKATETVE